MKYNSTSQPLLLLLTPIHLGAREDNKKPINNSSLLQQRFPFGENGARVYQTLNEFEKSDLSMILLPTTSRPYYTPRRNLALVENHCIV